MPDLLGATNPTPGYDKAINNRPTQVPTQNTQLQNVPDLNRVSRADRRTEQQDNNFQGNGNIRYSSNFQTFLQRLKEIPSMAETLATIFSGGEATVVLSGMEEGIALEMSQLLEMLKMNEQQLLDFLSGQLKSGTRFGGALFALLRSAYARAGSETVRNDILQFLKSYVDYSSTQHLEGNMLRNLARMADAMPARWGDPLRELLAQLENSIDAKDRQGSLQLIQKGIFPHMARYVEQTHDMGLPRQLLSLLALDTARYENGSEEKLLEYFHQLRGYGSLKSQLQMIDDAMLLRLLNQAQDYGDSAAVKFSDALIAAAAKALRGDGSMQVQQGFQNLLAAMLINESVYIPLNHYILPMEMDGRMLFSELWVDPDAEEDRKNSSMDPEGGSVTRILLKIDVQSLGLFDLVLVCQKEKVDLQLACPESVAPFSRQIEQSITQILTKNELKPLRVSVRKMEQPLALTDVFPKIFQGRDSVNVKA